MYNVGILESYRQKRFSFFQWQRQSSLTAKIVMAFSMAAVTGLLAQVKFYLPFTPVPIVATQLGVILAAVLLGRNWGGLSMIIYALGGFAGIPWFADLNGGLAALTGPTTGYIIGFILAAFFMGHLYDTQVEKRRTLSVTGIIIFAQLVLVYVPGLIYLAFWLKLVSGQTISLASVLLMGYVPFIFIDILKSLVGATVAKALLPMEEY
ncbi:MAG: biotin transporter BioY [Gracilibacter sp. BRH_c7a]|nr:MAG: biotin transporter BioY [Gracilibacter sp. BRH_c7a]